MVAFFLASLLLPLAFVMPPTARTTPRVARISPQMCDWSANDEESLHDAIRASSQTRLGDAREALAGLDAAWVLIFNCGMADEGVYTLQGPSERSSSYVLTFEATDDAQRFAELLQAEGFDLATPLRWETPHLEDFCHHGHFEVSLVPSGCLINPPEKNEFDSDAFNRLEMGGDPGLDKYMEERARLERIFFSM